MPVPSRYLPLVGGLALLPVIVYLVERPEVGAVLSIVSTILIVGSIVVMFSGDSRRARGKVYGVDRSS